jgi:hypothetical protein
MIKDPIVEDIRKTARKIEGKFKNDFHQYFLMLQNADKKYVGLGQKVYPAKPSPSIS